MNLLFNSTRNLGVLIAVGVLAIIVFGVLLRALQSWRKTIVSKSWPTAMGTVLSATVAAGRTSGRNGTSYYPLVVYEYAVNGQRYTGNRLRFGSQIGVELQSWAASALGKYPAGGSVPVYYNPDNPAEAVLIRNASGNWGNIIVLLIMIAAIVIVLTRFGGITLPFGR